MKLLIVEDEHRIAQAIKKGLEQERYTVDVAYTGNEGHDLALTETYDCIILDLMLPGMTGLEICRDLRKQKNHTPVLILTAKGQTQDKVDGFDIGADDYLTKPFAFEELLARIRALIRRPTAIVESTLNIDDLTLNTRTFQVERNGTQIQLTSKEFSLLEYLMRHPNQICTKEQIMTRVWDYESDILPNTVEVYIKNLRQKIDISFPKLHNLIHTKRGFGYYFGV